MAEVWDKGKRVNAPQSEELAILLQDARVLRAAKRGVFVCNYWPSNLTAAKVLAKRKARNQ